MEAFSHDFYREPLRARLQNVRKQTSGKLSEL